MMKKLGVDYNSMNLIEEIIQKKDDDLLKAGDKVTIDVEAIMTRKNYHELKQDYRDFVESSAGKVFTVVKEEKYAHKPIVSLEEDTSQVKWLFWEGELIKNEEG